MPDTVELAITGLGAHGDGLAMHEGEPVFVPGALPGERVRVALDGARGRLSEVLTPASGRAVPVCRHFGVCGGCVAQHMPAAVYQDWKRRMVTSAFAQRGISAEIGPLATIAGASRRRAVLTARRNGRDVELGYHRQASDTLVPIGECPVLTPRIVKALPMLADLCALVLKECHEVRCTVLDAEPALDVCLTTEDGRISEANRARLVQRAAETGIARLTLDGTIVLARARPTLQLGRAVVAPPPAAFVQAVGEAENLMAEQVISALGKAKRLADLFCGVGTFTLRLARTARVLAVDSDAAAIAALADAARHNQGLKPIETRVRDLIREPLSPKELEAFEAVLFDPPRAGAKAQAESLARSKVRIVIAVSCHPPTLARDAEALIGGGFALAKVTPIDQFLYSAHVEAVAVFARR